MSDEAATVRYSKRHVETRKGFALRDLGLLVALMLLGFGLRVWHVGQPNKMYFDEIYYVDAADKLWSGQPDPNSVHPPLGKWLIGLGIHAADHFLPRSTTQPFKWRIASVIAGTLMVGITYGLGLLLFDYNRTAAGLAGFFVATEHLHVASSRIAMLDPFLALLCLLGIWGAMKYFLGSHERWAVLSAFSLGLATGTKWSGLFTAFGCLMAGWWLDRNEPTRDRTQRYFFWLALLVPIGFFLTYLHLFLADGFHLDTFWEIFGQGKRMVDFRRDTHQFTHRYLSYFWSWPLVLEPIWLFFEENKDAHTVHAICAMGTPVFWWGFLVLLFERALTAFGRLKNDRPAQGPPGQDPHLQEKRIAGALVILWFCQWIPWCVSYTGGFFYYMLTEVPIMALLVGKLTADLLNFHDALGEGRWRGWLILGVYLVAFALYYPFATAREVPRSYFNKLFFQQWIVGHPEAEKKAAKTHT
jgi:dolichyl-phosphate-mannose--protein O-mannosyl transferase